MARYRAIAGGDWPAKVRARRQDGTVDIDVDMGAFGEMALTRIKIGSGNGEVSVDEKPNG